MAEGLGRGRKGFNFVSLKECCRFLIRWNRYFSKSWPKDISKEWVSIEQPLLWAASGKGCMNCSEQGPPTTNKGSVITERKVGESQDRSSHYFFHGLEIALAEYLPCGLVATQKMIKSYFLTKCSGCRCIFLSALSSSDFFLVVSMPANQETQLTNGAKKRFGLSWLLDRVFRPRRPGCIPRCCQLQKDGDFRGVSTGTWSSVRLISIRFLHKGSVWSMGREDHPASEWLLCHLRGRYIPQWAVPWGKDEIFQIPWEVCFHAYTAITKRRDEVLTQLILVGKTDTQGRKREKSTLFHTSLPLLPHTPQYLLFVSPWPRCHCSLLVVGAAGQHLRVQSLNPLSWCTQQSCRNILCLTSPAPRCLSLDYHNLTLL